MVIIENSIKIVHEIEIIIINYFYSFFFFFSFVNYCHDFIFILIGYCQAFHRIFHKSLIISKDELRADLIFIVYSLYCRG